MKPPKAPREQYLKMQIIFLENPASPSDARYYFTAVTKSLKLIKNTEKEGSLTQIGIGFLNPVLPLKS